MRKFLTAVSRWFPVSYAKRSDGGTYLERYYLRRGKKVSVYLHHFLSSDPDPELHDHPADWAFGIILCGQYMEERRFPPGWTSWNSGGKCKDWHWATFHPKHWVKWYSWGMVNFIRGTDFHRIHLAPNEDCWTLFVRGPRVKTWGFLQNDGSRSTILGKLSDERTME